MSWLTVEYDNFFLETMINNAYQILQLAPNNVWAYGDLSFAYEELGQLEKAIAKVDGVELAQDDFQSENRASNGGVVFIDC